MADISHSFRLVVRLDIHLQDIIECRDQFQQAGLAIIGHVNDLPGSTYRFSCQQIPLHHIGDEGKVSCLDHLQK